MDASGKVLASNNDADRDTTDSAAVFEFHHKCGRSRSLRAYR
jgi:hypothetical protein